MSDESAAFLYDPARLYSPRYVHDVLDAHGIRLKKGLGQNFLFDRNAILKIVNAAGVGPDDVVLEIGPGMGHLTFALLARAKHVIAVEIDQRLLPVLKGLLGGFSNFTLVHADILEVDLAARLGEAGLMPTKVVANVPYYVTTPILTHLVESGVPFDNVTLTIQKEVAERYVAAPGTKAYGSISVVMNYWGRTRLCGTVPASCFFPRPQVDSAVIRVDLFKQPPVGLANKALFHRVIRMAFNQRRKMLRNSLHALETEGFALDRALAAAGIDEKVRAERLTMEDYARLADALITETAE